MVNCQYCKNACICRVLAMAKEMTGTVWLEVSQCRLFDSSTAPSLQVAAPAAMRDLSTQAEKIKQILAQQKEEEVVPVEETKENSLTFICPICKQVISESHRCSKCDRVVCVNCMMEELDPVTRETVSVCSECW